MRPRAVRRVTNSTQRRRSDSIASARTNGAFVFGSVAAGADHAARDIDLFIVSDDLAFAELFAALETCAQRAALWVLDGIDVEIDIELGPTTMLRRRTAHAGEFAKRELPEPWELRKGEEELPLTQQEPEPTRRQSADANGVRGPSISQGSHLGIASRCSSIRRLASARRCNRNPQFLASRTWGVSQNFASPVRALSRVVCEKRAQL